MTLMTKKYCIIEAKNLTSLPDYLMDGWSDRWYILYFNSDASNYFCYLFPVSPLFIVNFSRKYRVLVENY